MCRQCDAQRRWRENRSYYDRYKDSHRAKYREYYKAYNGDHKGTRIVARFAKLGCDPFDYDEMVRKQDGKCAICGGTNKGRDLCVDHDHVTLKVRALLCHNCNAGMGNFKDNAERMRVAADYLDHHHLMGEP